MAVYNVTKTDIELLHCSKSLCVKVYLLDKDHKTILDELSGYITSGDGSDDANSDIRKTCNFTIHSYDSSYDLGWYNRFWLDQLVRVDLGFEYFDKIYYYTKGIYVFDQCSYTYDGSTKDLSFQCSDLVSTIDGTHGGNILGKCPDCTNIPLEKCEEHRGKIFPDIIKINGCALLDEDNGTYTGTDIKHFVERLLEDNGITEYRVDTIGQVSCLQRYSANWKKNRMDTGSTQEEVDRDEENEYDALEGDDGIVCDHGTWHMIPYDLEFDKDVTLWEILVKIRDLYPGYEMFFDKDGVFVFQLIPICQHDMNVLDHTQFEGLVISENTDLDLTTVKNATYVYGQSIETDRYTEEGTVEKVTYNDTTVLSVKLTLSNFSYKSNLILGIIFPQTTIEHTNEKAYLTLNDKTHPIAKRNVSIVKYEKFSEAENYKTDDCCLYNNVVYKFVANKEAGVWDSKVVERLTTSTSESEASNLVTYESIEYSAFNNTDMYCFKWLQNQQLWVYTGMYQVEGYCQNNDKDSPFAIDKIGYRPQFKSGGDYDNITSSSLAEDRAKYENWLVSRFTDTVTLETVIIPFLEVNQKIQYRKLSDGSIDSYIIKSLSYSFTEGTMTITMMKFYEQHPFIIGS